MSNSYLGFQREILTLPVKTNITVGKVVTMGENGIALPAADSDFIGLLDSVRGNVAGVQMKGYVECRYSTPAPTLGMCGLVSDASGNVKASDSAMGKYRVLHVDTNIRVVGFIL